MASRNQLFGIDQKRDEPRLEYDQNDNLLSREESIRRLFWMFFGLGFILASGLLFFIILAFFLSVTGPQVLPSYEIEQKLFKPYLQVLHNNGSVNICEMKIHKSKFSLVNGMNH